LPGPPQRFHAARNEHAAPLKFGDWLAITPASKPLDACRKVFGIRLKEIVFMLEVKYGVLLLALLDVEAEAIPMTGCRERQTIHCLGFFVFKTVCIAFDSKLVRPENRSRKSFLLIDVLERGWTNGTDEIDVGLRELCLGPSLNSLDVPIRLDFAGMSLDVLT
jgi:hypothetical protein